MSIGLLTRADDGQPFLYSVESLSHQEWDLLQTDLADIWWWANGGMYQQLQTSFGRLSTLLDDLRFDGQRSAATTAREAERFSAEMETWLIALGQHRDHMRARFVDLYGRTGEPVEHLDRARSREFDGTDSYSVTENLRDYVQHAGHLPLVRRVTKDGSRYVVDREQFIRSWSGWKRKARGVLTERANEFSLMPDVMSRMRSEYRILQSMMVWLTRDLRISIENLREAIEIADAREARDIPGLFVIDRWPPNHPALPAAHHDGTEKISYHIDILSSMAIDFVESAVNALDPLPMDELALAAATHGFGSSVVDYLLTEDPD